jgi:CPA1 family monovalent cation:H+ antiporter
VLGGRLPWPVPITYAAGGCLISLWPAFPVISLDPGFFFLLFVPPQLTPFHESAMPSPCRIG